jgi:hypothetical protein
MFLGKNGKGARRFCEEHKYKIDLEAIIMPIFKKYKNIESWLSTKLQLANWVWQRFLTLGIPALNRWTAGGFLVFSLTVTGNLSAHASVLDAIGLTLLETQTNFNGAGVRVAQVEADDPAGGDFDVNPAAVRQPMTLFSYHSVDGLTNVFPNVDGDESSHADQVAQNFYGLGSGVATNLAHVDNYEASDFVAIGGLGTIGLGSFIVFMPGPVYDPVVNQSFAIPCATMAELVAIDSAYDNYATQYNTLFVSAVGDAGGVNAPSTSYNGLGVGACGGATSTGPTPDNGRAKPDLVAPASATSFSAPLVSGAAAVLIQAGLQGAGGADTNSAVSICTLKALLINGAIKPLGWTNISPSPLDVHYGAGVLNLFDSYQQLAGGKNGCRATSQVPAGTAHPPTGAAETVPVLSGWDFNTNTSSSASDSVNHYYFNVTNGLAGATFTTTATLVWNRQQNQTNINNLSLFLYDTASSNLVASSVSTVDNVQHVWVPRLPAGRYDLQVWKAGGDSIVSASETYALAFEFFATPLNISKTATTMTFSWPVYPAGFMLASATDPSLPSNMWNTNYPAPAVVKSQNQIVLANPNLAGFFRLVRP